MKRYTGFLIAVQLFTGINLIAQEKKGTIIRYDSLISSELKFPQVSFTKFYFDYGSSLAYKSPDANDSALVKDYAYLIGAIPDAYNYEKYASLASALWEFGRLSEAEKMLRTIIQSERSFYTYTTYHSSGSTYEYGSFTSNYKHEACLTLARILIEKKKFKEALEYVKAAQFKYKTYFTCGTGMNAQQSRFRAYYSVCYQGAGMIDSGIRLLLHYALDGGYEGLSYFLKKKYSKAQLKKYMDIAYANIKFVRDKDSSYSFTTTDGGKTEIKNAYINGKAFTILFGTKVDFPYLWLENGEVATKKHFQDAFKDSRLYQELLGE